MKFKARCPTPRARLGRAHKEIVAATAKPRGPLLLGKRSAQAPIAPRQRPRQATPRRNSLPQRSLVVDKALLQTRRSASPTKSGHNPHAKLCTSCAYSRARLHMSPRPPIEDRGAGEDTAEGSGSDSPCRRGATCEPRCAWWLQTHALLVARTQRLTRTLQPCTDCKITRPDLG